MQLVLDVLGAIGSTDPRVEPDLHVLLLRQKGTLPAPCWWRRKLLMSHGVDPAGDEPPFVALSCVRVGRLEVDAQVDDVGILHPRRRQTPGLRDVERRCTNRCRYLPRGHRPHKTLVPLGWVEHGTFTRGCQDR